VTDNITFAAIEQSPTALLFVLSTERRIPKAQVECIREQFKWINQKIGREIPVVILEDGMKLETLIDPRLKAKSERTDAL